MTPGKLHKTSLSTAGFAPTTWSDAIRMAIFGSADGQRTCSNVGGTKVFPWEIENILMSHPDIEEALVYGQRDARFGEVPHAKVKARNAASVSKREWLRYVNERLAILKNLRKVEFVSELPRTNTGKVKRWG
jgi:acyl-coenzyme A synthetase/AMP-(fatty) acid ligase